MTQNSTQVDEILKRAREELSGSEQEELLDDILQKYSEADQHLSNSLKKDACVDAEGSADDSAAGDGEDDTKHTLRHAFLHVVRNDPNVLEGETVSNFLATEIKPRDFDSLRWESPEHMIIFCEALYGFRFATEEVTGRVRSHVRTLLRQALWQYEQKEEWEKLFLLLRIAPTSPVMEDVELTRLRHKARAYEIRRTRHNSRALYSYLLVQILLVVIVFPFLFIYTENGVIQRQVEQLTDIELGQEGYRLYTYLDGLYWSVITAGSIGYGDITPQTSIGRVIAGVLGTMGVVTAGVIAGLVLKWITPRELD